MIAMPLRELKALVVSTGNEIRAIPGGTRKSGPPSRLLPKGDFKIIQRDADDWRITDPSFESCQRFATGDLSNRHELANQDHYLRILLGINSVTKAEVDLQGPVVPAERAAQGQEKHDVVFVGKLYKQNQRH